MGKKKDKKKKDKKKDKGGDDKDEKGQGEGEGGTEDGKDEGSATEKKDDKEGAGDDKKDKEGKGKGDEEKDKDEEKKKSKDKDKEKGKEKDKDKDTYDDPVSKIKKAVNLDSIKAGQRVPPLQNYTLDLTCLTAQEERILKGVVDRDEAEMKGTRDFVKLLKAELDILRYKGVGKKGARAKCLRCRKKYGAWRKLIPFIDKGVRCMRCHFKTCPQCRHKQANGMFMCGLCVRYREIKYMTGEWLDPTLKIWGSELIKVSLRDKERYQALHMTREKRKNDLLNKLNSLHGKKKGTKGDTFSLWSTGKDEKKKGKKDKKGKKGKKGKKDKKDKKDKQDNEMDTENEEMKDKKDKKDKKGKKDKKKKKKKKKDKDKDKDKDNNAASGYPLFDTNASYAAGQVERYAHQLTGRIYGNQCLGRSREYNLSSFGNTPRRQQAWLQPRTSEDVYVIRPELKGRSRFLTEIHRSSKPGAYGSTCKGVSVEAEDNLAVDGHGCGSKEGGDSEWETVDLDLDGEWEDDEDGEWVTEEIEELGNVNAEINAGKDCVEVGGHAKMTDVGEVHGISYKQKEGAVKETEYARLGKKRVERYGRMCKIMDSIYKHHITKGEDASHHVDKIIQADDKLSSSDEHGFFEEPQLKSCHVDEENLTEICKPIRQDITLNGYCVSTSISSLCLRSISDVDCSKATVHDATKVRSEREKNVILRVNRKQQTPVATVSEASAGQEFNRDSMISQDRISVMARKCKHVTIRSKDSGCQVESAALLPSEFATIDETHSSEIRLVARRVAVRSDQIHTPHELSDNTAKVSHTPVDDKARADRFHVEKGRISSGQANGSGINTETQHKLQEDPLNKTTCRSRNKFPKKRAIVCRSVSSLTGRCHVKERGGREQRPLSFRSCRASSSYGPPSIQQFQCTNRQPALKLNPDHICQHQASFGPSKGSNLDKIVHKPENAGSLSPSIEAHEMDGHHKPGGDPSVFGDNDNKSRCHGAYVPDKSSHQTKPVITVGLGNVRKEQLGENAIRFIKHSRPTAQAACIDSDTGTNSTRLLVGGKSRKHGHLGFGNTSSANVFPEEKISIGKVGYKIPKQLSSGDISSAYVKHGHSEHTYTNPLYSQGMYERKSLKANGASLDTCCTGVGNSNGSLFQLLASGQSTAYGTERFRDRGNLHIGCHMYRNKHPHSSELIALPPAADPNCQSEAQDLSVSLWSQAKLNSNTSGSDKRLDNWKLAGQSVELGSNPHFIRKYVTQGRPRRTLGQIRSAIIEAFATARVRSASKTAADRAK